jgi:hypothetical protein
LCTISSFPWTLPLKDTRRECSPAETPITEKVSNESLINLRRPSKFNCRDKTLYRICHTCGHLYTVFRRG